MEVETNTGSLYSAGFQKPEDHECDFEVVPGYKVIGFQGVMQVMTNECRLLNLAVSSKQLQSDCETAENSVTYRDVIQQKLEMFNVMKTEQWDQVKRIRAVKLYNGRLISLTKEKSKHEVLGGIVVVYELRSGEEFEDGITGLKCSIPEQEPVVLELKDNEYITNVTVVGTEYIKSLTIETNFYRKIKQGAKQEKEEQSALGIANESSENTGVKKMDFLKKQQDAETQSIVMPAGAKVVAFAGTADDYLRSVFTYYKI